MGVISVWHGAVTPTSVKVVTEVTGTSPKLIVSPWMDLSDATVYTATPVNGIATIVASGLEPSTQYYYAVEDGVVERSLEGSFQTFPPLGQPSSFKIIAASCAGHVPDTYSVDGISNHPVFEAIAEHEPLLYIDMGDSFYLNATENDPALFRDAYRRLLQSRRPAKLFANVSIDKAVDDHDYADNGSDSTSPAGPAARLVYDEMVPHYDLPDPNALYHSFGIGRALIVVLDVRSARLPNATPDTPAKTMLGADQKAWFEAKINNPGFDARYLVVVSPSQWMGVSSDSWAAFTHERDELVAMLGNAGWLNRMCIVSGDMHGLAMSSPQGNPWGGFPVFQFAALDAEGGPVYNQYDLGPTSPGRNRYGTLEFHDCGAGITVKGTGYIGHDVWQSYTHVVPMEGETSVRTIAEHYQTANENAFTSTSWIAGSSTCGKWFAAPASGAVEVYWGARMQSDTGIGVLVSVEVLDDENAVHTAADEDYAIETAGVAGGNVQYGNSCAVTGLTPGAMYFARTVHKVAGTGTATIYSRRLRVSI